MAKKLSCMSDYVKTRAPCTRRNKSSGNGTYSCNCNLYCACCCSITAKPVRIAVAAVCTAQASNDVHLELCGLRCCFSSHWCCSCCCCSVPTCAHPRAMRKPVMTSSKHSTAPSAVHMSRRPYSKHTHAHTQSGHGRRVMTLQHDTYKQRHCLRWQCLCLQSACRTVSA